MATHDEPLAYIKRTRHYYQVLGYGEPYQWAHYKDIPFTPLTKPLAECRVGIVTTAAPYQPDKGNQDPGAELNAAAKFFEVYALPSNIEPDLRISHIAIDRDHTTAEDIGTYFPLAALQHAASENLIASVAERFYGLPTNRSKRTTIETDCEKLLGMCKQDEVDIAILVPNCPVCHQSVSLAARTLEAAGIVSVVLGCAKDIVEHVGVPRLVFSDFPLGNAAGLPFDKACQNDTVNLALDLAATATTPATTVQSPYQWSGHPDWKNDYSNPDKLTQTEIKQKRKAFDEAKKLAKQVKNE